jgi:hypothetical protein
MGDLTGSGPIDERLVQRAIASDREAAKGKVDVGECVCLEGSFKEQLIAAIARAGLESNCFDELLHAVEGIPVCTGMLEDQLKGQVADENEAHKYYLELAAKAKISGNDELANALTEIAHDEGKHLATLIHFLSG